MTLEYKSAEIANEKEEKCIGIHQCFGWELKSSQRIFNQNTRPTGSTTYSNGETRIHITTETVDFTKLLFQRDIEMPHYREIVSLEQSFWETLSSVPDEEPIVPTMMSFEAWTRSGKPWLLSTRKFVLVYGLCAFLAPALLVSLISLLCFVGIIEGTVTNDVAMWESFVACGICGVVACICAAIPGMFVYDKLGDTITKRKLKKGIDKMKASDRDSLQKQYEKYAEEQEKEISSKEAEATRYEKLQSRLRSLMQKAADLVAADKKFLSGS